MAPGFGLFVITLRQTTKKSPQGTRCVCIRLLAHGSLPYERGHYGGMWGGSVVRGDGDPEVQQHHCSVVTLKSHAQSVNGGSVADQAGLMAGDALIKVNGTEVFNMRHKEAQDVIVAAGNSFELTVSRGGATWKPSVTPTGSLPSPSPSLPGNITPVTRTSLAATPQEMKPIGSGHNTAAKPFAAVNGNDGQIKSIVNNQYNTPVGMYSDETIAETLSSQAEVLAGGVLGVNFKKNERVYSPANSEVYKLLHEQGDDPEPGNILEQGCPRNPCIDGESCTVPLCSTDTRTVTDTMLDIVGKSIDIPVQL
uniref:PDZ domain-containing protein n=1 Tax=Anopheles culicifacies TaxID=139723 RepID=A0A182M2U0_9DIPT